MRADPLLPARTPAFTVIPDPAAAVQQRFGRRWGTVITHEGPGMVCKALILCLRWLQLEILAASVWERIAKRIEIESDPFNVEQLRLKAEQIAIEPNVDVSSIPLVRR